jgi:hypothetical protein
MSGRRLPPQRQALRLSPLRIRHAHARMNFERLNMNAIDHEEDIPDENVSLRTRHPSINFAEITLREERDCSSSTCCYRLR